MKPPAIIAGISVRAYVIRMLQEDVARRERDAKDAAYDIDVELDPLTDAERARKRRIGRVAATRLRNEATRAREILDFFRTKFTVDER